jgi:hypothetical protein
MDRSLKTQFWLRDVWGLTSTPVLGVLSCPRCELDAVVKADAIKQLRNVVRGSPGRDDQLLRNLPVRASAHDQRHDLLLSCSESDLPTSAVCAPLPRCNP